MKKSNPRHPIDAIIGNNIRAIRQRRDISQETLGQRLEPPLGAGAISLYETGANRVSASVLAQMALALECAVSEFFDGVSGLLKEYETPGALNDVINSPDVQEAIRNMTQAMVQGLALKFQRK